MRSRFTVFILILSIFISNASFALSDNVYEELSTFSKILDIVDKAYVEPVDDKNLIKGAINGMLATLDPHTIYLPADAYKNFSSDTRGRFGGVGIEVSVRDGILTVISPLEDTPAWSAGIKPGDRIVSIDGEETKNMSLGEAVIKMRGPVGRKVELTIWRQGKTKSFTLVRTLIKVPGVKVEDLGDGYVLFRITTFQEGVSKALKKEYDQFNDKHGPIKGVLLDLRDNPGGLLSEAVRVSDMFLEKGVIVSTKGRNQKTDVRKAKRQGTVAETPMIILINKGSASASEIVAAALKDNGRARLLGTKSFGKGSVQTVINLDGGDALKITIAHYYTPKDKLIDNKGIEPDYIVNRKAYFKKLGIKDNDPKTKELTREQYNQFQKEEALAYLKRMK